jgi:hypothetical protein
LLAQQKKEDTIAPKKTYSPRFIPNIGYSIITGRFIKIGTWIRISSRIYGELAYAYYYENTENNKYVYSEVTKNKILFGSNIFVEQIPKNWFVNLSLAHHIVSYYGKEILSNRIQRSESNIQFFSINMGYTSNLYKKMGVILKAGLMYSTVPPNVYNGTQTFPNIEVSLRYSIH